jgi:hypothetical protein
MHSRAWASSRERLSFLRVGWKDDEKIRKAERTIAMRVGPLRESAVDETWPDRLIRGRELVYQDV